MHILVTFKNHVCILHLFILCIRILHIKQFKCKSLGANPASGPGCRVKPTHARDAWRMMSLDPGVVAVVKGGSGAAATGASAAT